MKGAEEGRRRGWKDAGRKRGRVGGIFRSVTDCVHVFECFYQAAPINTFIDRRGEEEQRDEEEVEIFLMSSVILNFLFSIFTKLQSEHRRKEEEEGDLLLEADRRFNGTSDWINRW